MTYAGRFRRLGSAIIDNLLLFILQIILIAVVSFFIGLGFGWLISSVILIIIAIFYHVFCVARYRGTVGKIVCGIEICRIKDNSNISYICAFWRVLLISIFFPLIILGLIYSFIDKKNRFLHDLICNTVVIKPEEKKSRFWLTFLVLIIVVIGLLYSQASKLNYITESFSTDSELENDMSFEKNNIELFFLEHSIPSSSDIPITTHAGPFLIKFLGENNPLKKISIIASTNKLKGYEELWGDDSSFDIPIIHINAVYDKNGNIMNEKEDRKALTYKRNSRLSQFSASKKLYDNAGVWGERRFKIFANYSDIDIDKIEGEIEIDLPINVNRFVFDVNNDSDIQHSLDSQNFVTFTKINTNNNKHKYEIKGEILDKNVIDVKFINEDGSILEMNNLGYSISSGFRTKNMQTYKYDYELDTKPHKLQIDIFNEIKTMNYPFILEKNKTAGAPDYNKYLTIYQEYANAGNKDAQLQLAYMYGKGMGVNKDLNQMVKWLRAAAKSGSQGMGRNPQPYSFRSEDHPGRC